MPLGSLAGSSDQQYVAIKDSAETWRILNTWHEDLKMMVSADDEIPDDSEAVTVLSEGQFIALIKEAGRLGVLANVGVSSSMPTIGFEEDLASQEQEILELKLILILMHSS